MRHGTAMIVLAGGLAMAASPALAQADAPAQEERQGMAFTPPEWKTTVVERGENARQLRYSPTAGERQIIEMQMAMEQQAEMDGQPAGAPANITTTATYAITPGETRNGAIEYRAEFLDFGADADGMMGQQMRALLEGLIGARVQGRVDRRGQVQDRRVEIPGGGPPALQEQVRSILRSLDQFVVVFPEEEIGEGGSWRQEGTVQIEGVDVDQTTTFTVVSIDGDRIRIGVESRQQAGQQTVEVANAPGVEVELESLNGTTEGVVVVDLNRLAPVEAQADSSMDLVMHTQQMGQEMELTQSMQTNTTIEPGEEPEEARGG